MTARPRLRPSYRPVRRGAGTVQLGLTAEPGAVLLAGLDPCEVSLLERLDGSLTEPDVYALAAGWGVPRRRAAELLRVLRERGLLVDWPGAVAGPVPPERQHVVVAGTGPLADTVAAVLRRGGVGRVGEGGWAADLAEAELRAALAPWRPPGRSAGPHLVVAVIGSGGLDARGGHAWRGLGVPVLPVAADGGRVVVGPLVGPLVGSGTREPCLTCLELTRADREASWPGAVAVAFPKGPQEVALATLAAGAVAMLAHAVLAGDPVPAGVSVEARLPWPRLDHRRWEPHPACHAHEDRADQARVMR